MTAKVPAWLLVVVFALLHLGLSVLFLAVATHETLTSGGSSAPTWALFWVLAFPLAVADRCGAEVPVVAYLPNAILYGGLWLGVWRAGGRLFRRGAG